MVPNGVDRGLYLEDTDVFYDRFKTYFDANLYDDLYNKISNQMFPVGSVFITNYQLTSLEQITLPGNWHIDYHVLYNEDLIPVAYLHERTG
jgi:hypothetical protein